MSYGDKVIGTNHTLPTGAANKLHRRAVGRQVPQDRHLPGGDQRGFQRPLGRVLGRAARVESFEGHARSGDVRVAKFGGDALARGRRRCVGGVHGDLRSRGRTATVTGAGNGLGRAIGPLCRRGAPLVLVGRNPRSSTPSHGSRLAAEPCRALPGDVTDTAAVDARRSPLADNDVSILVNNAGVAGPVAALTDITPDDWDAVFAVNVRGIFLMCNAVLPGMIASGAGDIINIASVSGKRRSPHRTPYCASKAAVIGLTTTLAFEVGPAGVSVNTLSPGPVDGPRMERNFRLEAERSGISVAEAEAEYVSRAATGAWSPRPRSAAPWYPMIASRDCAAPTSISPRGWSRDRRIAAGARRSGGAPHRRAAADAGGGARRDGGGRRLRLRAGGLRARPSRCRRPPPAPRRRRAPSRSRGGSRRGGGARG